MYRYTNPECPVLLEEVVYMMSLVANMLQCEKVLKT